MMALWNTNEQGVVLGGYDVVSYFERNEAVRGSADHSADFEGATFWFSSDENRRKFQEDPTRFTPAYGGFCAFAVAAKGAAVPCDPRTFKIRDGRLFLFYNDFHEGRPLNTAVLWNKDERAMLEQADRNWETLTARP
ncbi:MAG: YHS domain-containing protein [Gemmatimonadetes bacterium]|nr:MAG: YHS domain-containing protein [Gemmatimonadota bacterium]